MVRHAYHQLRNLPFLLLSTSSQTIFGVRRGFRSASAAPPKNSYSGQSPRDDLQVNHESSSLNRRLLQTSPSIPPSILTGSVSVPTRKRYRVTRSLGGSNTIIRSHTSHFQISTPSSLYCISKNAVSSQRALRFPSLTKYYSVSSPSHPFHRMLPHGHASLAIRRSSPWARLLLHISIIDHDLCTLGIFLVHTPQQNGGRLRRRPPEPTAPRHAISGRCRTPCPPRRRSPPRRSSP